MKRRSISTACAVAAFLGAGAVLACEISPANDAATTPAAVATKSQAPDAAAKVGRVRSWVSCVGNACARPVVAACEGKDCSQPIAR